MTKKSGPPGPKPLADSVHHGPESTIVSERIGGILLPSPSMPANDNEPSLVWMVGAFFGRHLHWLAPTVLLVAVAFIVLSFSS